MTDHAFGLLLAIFHQVFTRATPIGRGSVQDVIHGGGPLFGISAEDLESAGAGRGPRLAGAASPSSRTGAFSTSPRCCGPRASGRTSLGSKA